MSSTPNRNHTGRCTAPMSQLVEQMQKSLDSISARTRVLTRTSPTFLFLALVVSLECFLILLNAHQKPFWYDELFTLHLSELRPPSRMFSALLEGIDPMTIGFMSMMLPSSIMPLDPQIAYRLPSILCYVLTVICVFFFVRKRCSYPIALSASLLIMLSPFREYAIEARPYALQVGFLAMAVVCWQRIDTKRIFAWLFLIFYLLSVASHYYAALALLCFAFAEASFAWLHRRVRWPVWGTLLISVVLILAQLPLAVTFKSIYGGAYAGKPAWTSAYMTYAPYSGAGLNIALLLLCFAALLPLPVVLSRLRRGRIPLKFGHFHIPEVVLAYTLILYPGLLVVGTKILSAGYVPRYGWPFIIGAAIFLAILLGASERCWPPNVIALAFILVFGIQSVTNILLLAPKYNEQSSPASGWAALSRLSQHFKNEPIVVANGISYLEMRHYSEVGLRDRLLLLFEMDEAIRFSGSDTVDRSSLMLSRYVPLNIQDCHQFLKNNKRFLLYMTRSRYEWLPRYLQERGYHFKLLDEVNNKSIYLVTGT